MKTTVHLHLLRFRRVYNELTLYSVLSAYLHDAQLWHKNNLTFIVVIVSTGVIIMSRDVLILMEPLAEVYDLTQSTHFMFP